MLKIQVPNLLFCRSWFSRFGMEPRKLYVYWEWCLLLGNIAQPCLPDFSIELLLVAVPLALASAGFTSRCAFFFASLGFGILDQTTFQVLTRKCLGMLPLQCLLRFMAHTPRQAQAPWGTTIESALCTHIGLWLWECSVAVQMCIVPWGQAFACCLMHVTGFMIQMIINQLFTNCLCLEIDGYFYKARLGTVRCEATAGSFRKRT